MNTKQYSDKDFQMCMELLEYLESEMEYRMCSRVSSEFSGFDKKFPKRNDITLTNILITIKRVGVEKMKSDVSMFLKWYNQKLSKDVKWSSGNLVG